MPNNPKDDKLNFTKPLVVPRSWGALLAIEDFDALPADEYPTRVPRVMDHTKPYRDDFREASVEEHGLVVVACLKSGDNNYWMEYEVWQKGSQGAQLFHDDFPCSEISRGREEFLLLDGRTITVEVREEVR